MAIKLTIIQKKFLSYPLKKQQFIYTLALQGQHYELLKHLMPALTHKKKALFAKQTP